MSTAEHLSVEDASRLAVTATAADLEYWARTVAVDGQVGLNDLVRCLDMLREASAPEPSAAAHVPTLAAS
jgi:hypothetical protein